MDLKKIYIKYSGIIKPILLLKNALLGVKILKKGKNNTITGLDQCIFKRSCIRITGSNNVIQIGDMCTLIGMNISIYGSNNKIVIGSRCYLSGCSFCIEDDSNTIEVGEHVYIYNGTEISAIESTSVFVGNDCLFSANCMVRTGDSHGIFSKKTNSRINFSESISFGKHVWLGNGCKVLKGAMIFDGCVIGTGSIVTKYTQSCENSILVGIPAKVTSTEIEWKHTR